MIARLRQWWSDPQPWLVALVAFYLFAAGMGYELKRQSYDVSGFVFLGANSPHAAHPVFDGVTRRASEAGYDGQQYYAIARRPWAIPHPAIDHPVRQARILYPLLAWALSGGGDPRLLAWVLPALNLAIIVGLTYWAAAHAGRLGRSRWYALALPLMLNVLVPANRDLTDLLGFFGAFGLLAAWEGRARPAALFLMTAVALLAREQNGVVAACVLLAALHGRNGKAILAVAAGIAVLFAWIAALRLLGGAWPLMPTAGNVAPPLAGIEHWLDWTSHNIGMRLIRIAYAVFLGLQVGVLLRSLYRRECSAAMLVGWAGVLIVLVAGPSITDDYWSYTRNFFWLPLAGWMTAVRNQRAALLLGALLSLAFLPGTLHVL